MYVLLFLLILFIRNSTFTKIETAISISNNKISFSPSDTSVIPLNVKIEQSKKRVAELKEALVKEEENLIKLETTETLLQEKIGVLLGSQLEGEDVFSFVMQFIKKGSEKSM